MKTFFHYPTLQRAMLEGAEARTNALGDLREGVNNGTYRLGKDGLEIPDLLEAMTGIKPSRFLRNEVSEGDLKEHAGGVTMSDFKLLTTALISKEIQAAPVQAELIADKLYKVEPSDPRPNATPQPWIGGPTRWANSKVKELEPYKPVAPQNGFISYAPQEKNGATVPFSKEALLTRNSSWIIQSGQNARDGGLITREIEMLKYVAGTLGKWKFGKNDSTFTEYNTYNTAVTGSAVKNSLTANPLDSWTNIDTAMQAFRDMKDPVSGEFIAQPKSVVLIVPMCIFMKANVIKNAVVTTNYNAAIASATIRYEGPNPLNAALTMEILASPYFDEITGSTSSTYTWYMGQPTKCFVNDQVWAPKFEELSDGGEGSFWKDLALALKLSWMEQYVVQNNTQMLKIANS